MIFVSATRLHLKSYRFFIPFMIANQKIAKALVKNKGFLKGKELIDKQLVFWTLSMWNSEAEMRTFRGSAEHRNAMMKISDWCNEAAYVHWIQEEQNIPGWKTVHEKMLNEGLFTKLKYPSENHLSKKFAEPQWTRTERIFKTISV